MAYQVNMQDTEMAEGDYFDDALDAGQSDTESPLDAELARDNDVRAEIEKLGQRVYSSAPEPEVQSAYLKAAEIKFLSTIGRTVWKFMTNDQAQREIELALKQSVEETCPEDAKQLIEDGVQRLKDIHRDDIAYSVDDQNQSDLTELKDNVDATSKQLLDLILGGFTRYEPIKVTPEEAALLRKVDKLTSKRIGIDAKLRLAVLAKSTWPTSPFPTTSDILNQFYTEFTQQLKVDGLYNGLDTSTFSRIVQTATAPNTIASDPDAHDRATSQTASNLTNVNASTGQAAALSKGVIDGLGVFADMFHGSVEFGAWSFYRPCRTLGLENDDVNLITENTADYVKRVYEAIRDLPAEADSHQREMISSFEKKIRSLQHPEVTMTECSYMIVKALIDLHTDGDHLRPDQIEQIRPMKDDQAMSAVERMACILEILQKTKRVCVDILNGRDRISIFVAAPLASDKRKLMNKNNNLNKAAIAARGRAAEQAQLGRGEGAGTRSLAMASAPALGQGGVATHDNGPTYLPNFAQVSVPAPRSALAQNTFSLHQFTPLASNALGYQVPSHNPFSGTFSRLGDYPYAAPASYPASYVNHAASQTHEGPSAMGPGPFGSHDVSALSIPPFHVGYGRDLSGLPMMRPNEGFGDEDAHDEDEAQG